MTYSPSCCAGGGSLSPRSLHKLPRRSDTSDVEVRCCIIVSSVLPSNMPARKRRIVSLYRAITGVDERRAWSPGEQPLSLATSEGMKSVCSTVR